ncbi:MAG: alanine--tRNA ligase [Bacteroidota bacterium]
MSSREIRQQFLHFFKDKKHKIVASAPIVQKDDPTLMFTNAGMNQFKDFFLGDAEPDNPRIVDTQKCLRVSGKHNDLEEVGVDSYHHTMFEMLGNWSIGDYFKKEAIDWAWELLTQVYGLPEDRLYASIFMGDEKEKLERDEEAVEIWKQHVPEDRILDFDRKDNFWEMGETGPCGPCSEIHIDLRSDDERALVNGRDLVNADHPQVVEIWNLVFIQYNRKADGSLEELPAKHIDTGMGFERLTMALQGKTSNYDTDIFTPFIEKIEAISSKKYTYSYAMDAKVDIAMRVVADHIRAVAFAIADGQLPSNTGAGYVIRRILRRAVRYYYSFLNVEEPLLHQLVPMLADNFADVFPELKAQETFVKKVILEEEKSFLRTLESGLSRFESIVAKEGVIDGEEAFELYDTYGFPIDLTRLLATEKGWEVDEVTFEKALAAQKERSRSAAVKQVGDWTVLDDEQQVQFVGYDEDSVSDVAVLKYRTVKSKKGKAYQIVLNRTPFYAESGGQVGDSGTLSFGKEVIKVLDTKKENDLTIHIVDRLPENINAPVQATINTQKRALTENNHSATHLLHAALRDVLGAHVQQKGSLNNERYLRFDFQHFQKMTDEEIRQVEQIVNEKIRANITKGERRSVPIEEARNSGAMMLFGEKYGDEVRMITFDKDFSQELCGGCHVDSTGEIGYFKILSESAVAAGVRRIEAVTASAAEQHLNEELDTLDEVRQLFKNPKNVVKSVSDLQEENKQLQKRIEQLLNAQAAQIKTQLKSSFESINSVNVLVQQVDLADSKALKNLAYQLEKEVGDAVIVFGAVIKDKPQLMVTISENMTKEKNLNAGQIVRNSAKHIKGGGGGQAFFATAGGKDASGMDAALQAARTEIEAAVSM